MSLRVGVIAAFLLIALYGRHVALSEFVYEDALWLTTYAAASPPFVMRPRALAAWSWWLQLRLAPSPQVFHAVNVILHGCVVCLVYALSRRLGLTTGAVAAALVFAVHPLTVETVAYAAQRTELIAAIGVLWACLIASGPRWWAWQRQAAIVLLILVGLQGKESAIAIVGLLPLILWQTRQHDDETLLDRYNALTTLFAVLVAACVVAVGRYGAQIGEAGLAQTTATDWLLVQATAVQRLIALSFVPYGLTVDYDYDLVGRVWRLAAALVVLKVLFVSILLRRRWPIVSFGIWWTLVAVCPRLIVQTPRSYLNDHQWYVPLVGMALVFGAVYETVSPDSARYRTTSPTRSPLRGAVTSTPANWPQSEASR